MNTYNIKIGDIFKHKKTGEKVKIVKTEKGITTFCDLEVKINIPVASNRFIQIYEKDEGVKDDKRSYTRIDFIHK